MNWTDIVSAIAAALGALTGLVAAFLATRKFYESKKVEFEESRPYIIPNLILETFGNEQKVYLELKNVGDTPARGVRIEFTSSSAWNWVQKPDYPFLDDYGISAIGPGDSVKYFTGVVRKGNPLENIEAETFEGFVTFENPKGGKRLSDPFRMRLSENRFKAK